MLKKVVVLLMTCVLVLNMFMVSDLSDASLSVSAAVDSLSGNDYSVDFQYEDFSSYDAGKVTKLKNFTPYNNPVYIESDGEDSFLRLLKEYNANDSKNDILLQTDLYSAKTELVFSLDIQINNPGNEFGIRFGDIDGNTFNAAVFKGSKISYFNDYSYANRDEISNYPIGNGKKSRIAIKISPDFKMFSIYFDGQLVRSAGVEDISNNTGDDDFNFDFSSFWIRLYGLASPSVGLDTLIDNIYLYENLSDNKSYGVSLPLLFKNATRISNLYSGYIKANVFIEKLASGKEDTDNIVLIFAMYHEDLLSDILTFDVADFNSPMHVIDLNVNSSFGDSEDYCNFYLWNDGLIPVCKSVKFSKAKLYLPYSDEIHTYLTANSVNHPFIGANKSDFNRIKELINANDVYMTELYDELIAKCDRICKYSIDEIKSYDTPEKEYYIRHYIQDGIRLLYMSERVLDFVQSLAMAYNICDDEQKKETYAKRASEIILRVCGEGEYGFSDWNPGHFLDTGAMCTAVSLGYDWLYDYITDDTYTKNIILNALKERGIDLGISAYTNRIWWVGSTNNWNPACNGGLLYAALVYSERDPAYVSDLISGTLSKIPVAIKEFYPDGAWNEGLSYAISTSANVIKVISTVENVFNTDFGLGEIEGFDKSGEFFLYCEGPAGVNNFGDSNVFKVNSPVMHYYADRLGLPLLRDRQIARTQGSSVQSMILYNPNLSHAPVPAQKNKYFRGAELVSMRSSWDDDALWVSACGGDTLASHGHYDGGAFVIDYNGIRFASDLGSDTKNTKYYATEEYYRDAYRSRAEGHNTLVINPDSEPGQVDGFAFVEKSELDTDNPFAVINMSDVYDTADASSVKRGIALSDNSTTVTIRDEITLTDKSDIYWFLHSSAKLKIADGDIYMTSDDGTVMVLEFCSENAVAEVSVETAAPMIDKGSPDPSWQSKNIDYQKVCIKLTGDGKVTLTVKLRPININSCMSPESVSSLSQW